MPLFSYGENETGSLNDMFLCPCLRHLSWRHIMKAMCVLSYCCLIDVGICLDVVFFRPAFWFAFLRAFLSLKITFVLEMCRLSRFNLFMSQIFNPFFVLLFHQKAWKTLVEEMYFNPALCSPMAPAFHDRQNLWHLPFIID